MKYFRPFIISLFVFSCFSSSAQQLDNAFKTAKKENKIVMIVVESEKCIQCNEVANQGLSSDVVKRVLNASCILLREKKIPDELNSTYSTYSFPQDFFGTIYLDTNKNILQVYHGSSSFYKSYLDNLEKALKEKDSSTAKLSDLINNYYTQTRKFDAAFQLIEKIKKVALEPKGDLIDELVQKAPEDSATSLTFIQFIARTAPVIGSLAQSYAEKNHDNYNMAWYRMSLQERVAINNRIYQKSLQKAIAGKDISYMYRVAATRQNNFISQPQRMQQVQQESFLQYYKGIHDSTSYLASVIRFYDTYFMTVNVDSVLKADSVKKAGLFKNIPDKAGVIVVETRTQPIAFSQLASYYAGALNDGAWTVYTYTKKTAHLSKALLWAKRANEFAEVPEIMDTYARLLYKTDNRNVAIALETKAIEARKSKNITATEYEKVLEAMKKGGDKIDAY